ncbi:MAG: TerC family protein, partial [Pseudolabrys sp.]|nr:TerC family protein [Pseudolabrys sp.]
MSLLSEANAWAALLTLTALEVVLGIDNLVFISVLTARLDRRRAKTARAVGLSLAFVFRILLLASLSWLIGLTEPVLRIAAATLSWRDIILIAGGLFLLAKGTHEIHGEVEADDEPVRARHNQVLLWIVAQLVVVDLVFSIDSIVTAVGLAEHLEIMIAAVCIAMLVMYFAATPVGDFIAAHPTTKMLALAFLLLIGVALLADGFHFHIPRGYIYFAMAFAAAV